MALPVASVWEVRTTGSDSNGGGWNNRTPGTSVDYTQQDAAQLTLTDLAAASTSTTLTSATGGFTAAMVGSILQIASGTNAVVGFFEITAYTSSTQVTLDRTPTTGGAMSAATGSVGGALASPGKAAGVIPNGSKVHVKAGTYSITSTTANVAGGRVAATTGANGSDPLRWMGYQTTRGDGGTKPLLQASGAFASQTLVAGVAGQQYDNLEVDGASKTSVVGFSGNTECYNCKASNCTNGGFSGGMHLVRCEATGCSGATAAFAMTSNFGIESCSAHDNTATGFSCQQNTLQNCLAWNNTGANGYGFRPTAQHALLTRCLAYGNAQHGFYFTAVAGAIALGCLAVGNGGYGFNATAGTTGIRLWNCAAYNNTSGTFPASTFLETPGFVTLTADPFVAAGSQNFALNTTSGGGAALRAAGLPATWPGASTTSYPDIGPAQHADPAATGLGNWIGLV